MKNTLIEVTDQTVTIEMCMLWKSDGSEAAPVKKVDVPKIVHTHAEAAPDPADLAAAPEELVTTTAGVFKAKRVEKPSEQAGIKIGKKIWFSETVPGGVVKMEVTISRKGSSRTSVILAVVDKK